jgi:hypothetical protein
MTGEVIRVGMRIHGIWHWVLGIISYAVRKFMTVQPCVPSPSHHPFTAAESAPQLPRRPLRPSPSPFPYLVPGVQQYHQSHPG